MIWNWVTESNSENSTKYYFCLVDPLTKITPVNASNKNLKKKQLSYLQQDLLGNRNIAWAKKLLAPGPVRADGG